MGGSSQTTTTDRRAAAEIRDSIGEIIAATLGQAPGEVQIVSCEPLLTVLVTGTRTPLEGLLLDAGDPDLVRRGRDALRHALEDPLRAAVERALGVKVGELTGSHDPPSGTETLVFDVHASSGLLS